MALIRWQPFREIDELQQEMNRIFDSLGYSSLARKEEGSTSFVPQGKRKKNKAVICY